jgi:hypothetical protein
MSTAGRTSASIAGPRAADAHGPRLHRRRRTPLLRMISMDRRSLPLFLVGVLSMGIAGRRMAAQSDAYAKLVGTWVMDSTTGTGDHGLPKSETLVLARMGPSLHIAPTTDWGSGPVSTSFGCATTGVGGVNDLGGGTSSHCTTHASADSIVYALDVSKGGKLVSTERGRLVVSAGGKTLRDEYDATDSAGTAVTHHRHILTKQ